MEQEFQNQPVIVRYDNLLNEQTRLNQLSGKEQDLFFSIIGEFIRLNQDAKKKTLNIRIKELDVKRICGMTSANNNVNQEKLSEMLKHVSEIALTTLFTIRKYETDPETGEIIYDENNKPIYGKETQQIFHAFFEGKDKKDISVKLNPEAQRYFFGFLLGNFTQFFLESYISMSAKHAKSLYRQLLNGKNALNGHWEPSKKELMNWFGLKDNNGLKRFLKSLPTYTQQVLNTGDFVSLNYQYIYGTEKGNPIKQFRFKYELKPNRMDIIAKLHEKAELMSLLSPVYLRTIIETPTEKTIKKEPCICPHCQGKVYRMKTDEGYVFLCENNAENHLGTGQCTHNPTKGINYQQLWNDAVDKEEIYKKESSKKAAKSQTPEPITPHTSSTPNIPTEKEVKEFFESFLNEKGISSPVDYEDFYDYYESKGWMDNKDPIINWKARAKMWIRRQVRFNAENGVREKTTEENEEIDYEAKRRQVMQDFRDAGWSV